MEAVQSGMSDGAQQTTGTMGNITAGFDNITGAITEMKDETLAGAQDFGAQVAAKGKEYGDKIPSEEELKAKAAELNQKRQVATDADRAGWGVQGDGLIDGGVLTNRVGKALDPGNLVDGINTLIQNGEEQQRQVEAGHAQGLAAKKAEIAAEIAAKKAAAAPAAAGGRRRRRKSRKKKRRKSRKKKRKSKRTKRMARKSRRKRRSRRRRRRGGIKCKGAQIATYNDSDKTWTCGDPPTEPPTYKEPAKTKTIDGGRKSRKSRRRRKRSSKKSRRRRRR